MKNNEISQEILTWLRGYWTQYKEWMKPEPNDPTVLTVIKTFFKGLTAILLVAISPVVIILLTVAFVAAF
jgi:hypothetical protein